jgi:cysteinyl-tRNA synthetase
MDLQATHHTNEIAQSQACNHKAPVKYWMHTNMLTVNGVRMSKTAGNGFTPEELFTGNHKMLEKGYAPMAVRFFMTQTHYRSTLDFSNEALQGSEKGFARLMAALKTLNDLKASPTSSVNVIELEQKCYDAMNDDFNTPVLVAHLFDAVRIVNSVKDGKETLTQTDLNALKKMMNGFVFDVLGLSDDKSGASDDSTDGLMQLIFSIRNEAKLKKDFAISDKIRDELLKLNFTIKDEKDGTSWSKK